MVGSKTGIIYITLVQISDAAMSTDMVTYTENTDSEVYKVDCRCKLYHNFGRLIHNLFHYL